MHRRSLPGPGLRTVAEVACNNETNRTNQRVIPPSVTYVLTHECYPCPDCALRPPIPHSESRICPHGTVDFPLVIAFRHSVATEKLYRDPVRLIILRVRRFIV